MVWRLNNYVLDKEVVEKLQNEMEISFPLNIGSVDPTVLWEAFKVTMRGIIISFSSYKYKLRNIESSRKLEQFKSFGRETKM